jgi:hypothetical protein
MSMMGLVSVVSVLLLGVVVLLYMNQVERRIVSKEKRVVFYTEDSGGRIHLMD